MAYERKTWESRDKLSHEELNRMEDGVEAALATSPTGRVDSSLSNQAEEYSETSSYSVGDYCIYNNDLYKCVSEIGNKGEEWASDHWEKTSIASELLNILKELNTSNDNLFDKVYPVGSIYMSFENISPDKIFGGEWESIKDTFLLSSGDSYNAGDTGGAATVSLTSSQMPSHTHTIDSHTHSLPSHTHSTPSHTHSFSATATTGSAGSHTHSINIREDATTGGSKQRIGTSSTYTGTVNPCSSSGSHTHSVSVSGTTGSSSGTSGSTSGTSGGTSLTTNSTGSGSEHENMPPYIVVYMWKRVA